MKRILFVLMAVGFSSSSVFSQLWKMRRIELTISPGVTYFSGDLGKFSNKHSVIGFKDISINNTGLNISTSLKYRITDKVNARANFGAGNFHSSDLRGVFVSRNFESMTLFFEPSFMAEYYILRNDQEKSYLFEKKHKRPKAAFLSYIDFYVFGGFGGLMWDVTPNYALAFKMNSSTGFTPVIPAGLGIDYNYSGVYNAGLEFGGRYLLGDYADGYRLPGSVNDAYQFVNFTFSWNLKTYRPR
jgi:hypothetical protein